MANQTSTHHPSIQPRPAKDLQQQALDQLLQRQDVWRGQPQEGQFEVLASGHSELDNALHGGGWPVGGLVDVSLSHNGHGEWQLFGRALARLSQQAGLILLVNPPAMPYGPGLSQLGIDHTHLRVVHSSKCEAVIAAVVDALKAQCCLALMAWEGRFQWRYAQLRKLQLAASQSHCFTLCVRKDRPGRVQSPALLRLHSQLTEQGLQVQLLKQRGQHQPQTITLPQPSLWAPKHHQLLHNSWESYPHPNTPEAKVLAFNPRKPGGQ